MGEPTEREAGEQPSALSLEANEIATPQTTLALYGAIDAVFQRMGDTYPEESDRVKGKFFGHNHYDFGTMMSLSPSFRGSDAMWPGHIQRMQGGTGDISDFRGFRFSTDLFRGGSRLVFEIDEATILAFWPEYQARNSEDAGEYDPERFIFDYDLIVSRENPPTLVNKIWSEIVIDPETRVSPRVDDILRTAQESDALHVLTNLEAATFTSVFESILPSDD